MGSEMCIRDSAKSLGFIHPITSVEMFFESKRPKDFDMLLKSLKKASI